MTSEADWQVDQMINRNLNFSPFGRERDNLTSDEELNDRLFLSKWSVKELLEEIDSNLDLFSRLTIEKEVPEIVLGVMKFVDIYGGCSPKQRNVLESFIIKRLWKNNE